MKRVFCGILCLCLLLTCVLTAASAHTTTIKVPTSTQIKPKKTPPPEPAETVEAAESVETAEPSAEAPVEILPPETESVEPREEASEEASVEETTEAEEEKERKPLLRVHQIDIGCGDAYLLTVEDTVILVDCGTNTTDPIRERHTNAPLFDYLEASGIDHMDAHFVTHWHNDHCYNVDTLSRLYGTEDTVVYGPSEKIYAEFRNLPNGVYRQLKNGDRLTVGPLEILCVGPARSRITGEKNIDSLNFIVYYGEHTFMFTGDWVDRTVRTRWEQEITDIDVFSFPHHALKPIAINKETYAVINPRVVMIPSNERGNAREFALYTARVKRDAVYLSGKEGNALVTSDGVDLWTATWVTPGTLSLGDKVP